MKRLYTILILLALGLSSSLIKAEEPDWKNYSQLLKKYVKPGQINNVNLMTVNYSGIKSDAKFNKLVSQIEAFDTGKLSNDREKLSFYINAYNILAIKVVVDHWPVKSIKDVGSLFTSVWKKEAGKINRKVISLHEVEHEILRKMTEPRIHMAIVCASVSCPDLRLEAYSADKLDQQLNEQSKTFLANDKKGLYVKDNVVHVSKIFDWFEEDFEISGGVKSFIRQYNAGVTSSNEIDANIDYNWQLNGQ